MTSKVDKEDKLEAGPYGPDNIIPLKPGRYILQFTNGCYTIYVTEDDLGRTFGEICRGKWADEEYIRRWAINDPDHIMPPHAGKYILELPNGTVEVDVEEYDLGKTFGEIMRGELDG